MAAAEQHAQAWRLFNKNSLGPILVSDHQLVYLLLVDGLIVTLIKKRGT